MHKLEKNHIETKFHFYTFETQNRQKNIFFGISMCNNFVGPHKDALYKNLSKFSKNSGFA